MTRFILIAFAAVLMPFLASAKRIPPATVQPVVHQGVRYVAPNDDGRRAYIEAWDVQTNKKLWDSTVFTNRIDPKLEEDIQWVFIKTLSVRDGTLVVTSERGKTYKIDLETKAVTQSDPASSSAVDGSVQLHDIPEPVKKTITDGSLAKDYDVSVRVKPIYLQGDFNCDGKVDLAVLVKQRSTGKLGIAIIHGGKGKPTILGAGIGIGNGGDDFEWMDYWQIYSKGRAELGTDETAPRLRGDGLLVGKSESASALIYWNGKRYVWLQQGN